MALKKNLFYNLLLSISQILFPLVSIPYISRVLSAEGIGKVNTIDSLTYFIVVIAELGLSTYGVREIAKVQNSKEQLKQRTNELISLHIFSTVVTCIIYVVGIYFIWQKLHSTTMLLFSFLFFITNIFNCEWYYWGTEKFKYIAIRSILTRLGGLIFIFLLIKTPSDFEKYYGIMVCSILLNIVLNAYQILPNFKFNFNTIKSDFKACLPVYFIGLIHSVTLMLDNVILGFTSSFAFVAYYANAVKIVRISGALITDSFFVFFPRTTVLIQEKNEIELKSVLEKTIQLICILTIPLSIGLFIYAKEFTSIYFGPNLILVVNNLMILSLYPILKSFSLFFSKQILMSYEKDKLALNGYIIGSFSFVILCIILSYIYHDIGCSVALIISEIIMLIYFLFQAKIFLTGIPIHFFKNGLTIVLTIFIFYCVKMGVNTLELNSFISFLLSIFSSLILYGLLVLYVMKYKIAKEFLTIIKSKM